LEQEAARTAQRRKGEAEGKPLPTLTVEDLLAVPQETANGLYKQAVEEIQRDRNLSPEGKQRKIAEADALRHKMLAVADLDTEKMLADVEAEIAEESKPPAVKGGEAGRALEVTMLTSIHNTAGVTGLVPELRRVLDDPDLGPTSAAARACADLIPGLLERAYTAATPGSPAFKQAGELKREVADLLAGMTTLRQAQAAVKAKWLEGQRRRVVLLRRWRDGTPPSARF